MTSIPCTTTHSGLSFGTPATAASPQLLAQQAFPRRLYTLLQAPGFDHLIAWTADGSAFLIWDTNRFTEDVLVSHFHHTKFASFARQLNLYGFRRQRLSPLDAQTLAGSMPLPATDKADELGGNWWKEACLVQHRCFHRDKPELLARIAKKANSSPLISSSSPHNPVHQDFNFNPSYSHEDSLIAEELEDQTQPIYDEHRHVHGNEQVQLLELRVKELEHILGQVISSVQYLFNFAESTLRKNVAEVQPTFLQDPSFGFPTPAPSPSPLSSQQSFRRPHPHSTSHYSQGPTPHSHSNHTPPASYHSMNFSNPHTMSHSNGHSPRAGAKRNGYHEIQTSSNCSSTFPTPSHRQHQGSLEGDNESIVTQSTVHPLSSASMSRHPYHHQQSRMRLRIPSYLQAHEDPLLSMNELDTLNNENRGWPTQQQPE